MAEQINRDLEVYQVELPACCNIYLPKHSRIEKLESKYMLIAHPTPSFEGEMLLIQPIDKKDKTADKEKKEKDKDMIVYRDYSLRKRLPNREKPQISAAEKLKDKKKKESEVSKIHSLEIDISEPLCNAEWFQIAEVLNYVRGLAWFQVLPVG